MQGKCVLKAKASEYFHYIDVKQIAELQKFCGGSNLFRTEWTETKHSPMYGLLVLRTHSQAQTLDISLGHYVIREKDEEDSELVHYTYQSLNEAQFKKAYDIVEEKPEPITEVPQPVPAPKGVAALIRKVTK